VLTDVQPQSERVSYTNDQRRAGRIVPTSVGPNRRNVWYIVLFATNSEERAWWDVGFWISGKRYVSIQATQPTTRSAMKTIVQLAVLIILGLFASGAFCQHRVEERSALRYAIAT
jgi:hypothetical protein